jgi:hypothetical protein
MNNINAPASIHKKTESTGEFKKLSEDPELLCEIGGGEDDEVFLLFEEEEPELEFITVSWLFNKLSMYFIYANALLFRQASSESAGTSCE